MVRACVEIKILRRVRVVLHAIDATPARWRGDAGSSPLDRARSAATHWLISTQVRAWVRKWDQQMERRTAPLLVLTTVGASAAGSARPRVRMLANGWARRWGPRLGCSSARGTAPASARRWARSSARACVVAVVKFCVLWADGVLKSGGRRVGTSARKWGPRWGRMRAPARGAPWAPATASASATSRARTWGRSCAGVLFVLSRRRRSCSLGGGAATP